jgi:hypothetical protein
MKLSDRNIVSEIVYVTCISCLDLHLKKQHVAFDDEF